MAMDLFQKALFVLKAEGHSLLNKKVNTIEGFEQYNRELDSAIHDVGSGLDQGVGNANELQRQIDRLTREKDEALSNAKLLRTDDDPSNDNAAVQFMLRVKSLMGQIERTQQQLTDQKNSNDQVREAYTSLQAKLAESHAKLQELRQSKTITTAQNKASSALETAVSMTDVNGVDNIEAALNSTRATADARLARVTSGLAAGKSPEEAADLAWAQAELEKLGTEVTQEAATTPGPAATTS